MSHTTPPVSGVEPPSSSLEGFDRLAELALDLRRSWHHPANNLWRQLDPALWDLMACHKHTFGLAFGVAAKM